MATDGDIILEIARPVTLIACRKCGQAIDVNGLPLFQVIACPVCQTSQKVPAELKNFLVFDVLGRGGMATVYRALDRTLQRQVAIKIMRGSLEEDPAYVSNFLREARAAAQLNHPNIVQIYSVDEAGGHPFIVMELLDGGRLDEMIARGQPVKEEFVLQTGLQVASGLAAAAERGLIHGDVKPANILFDRSGTAKITDFGLARFQQKPLSQGEIWGTPYYIAPEKVRERREDFRSDIYSLGATLYHALALTPPFEGETATDVVLARLKELPPPIEQFRSDLHPETIEVIHRMLEADPAQRYPTYASLIHDLQAAIAALQTSPPSRVRAAEPPRRRVGWIIAAAIAAVALVGGGVAWTVHWMRRSSKPAPPRPAETTPTAPSGRTSAAPVVATPPLQPFSSTELRRLVEAFNAWDAGDVHRYEQALAALAKELPTNHTGRAWIAVMLAVPPWLRGDQPEATRRLSRLLEVRYDRMPDGSAHPSALAQQLARAMVRQPLTAVHAEDRPPPEWWNRLRDGFLGGHAIAEGKLDEAAKLLESASRPVTDAPPWVPRVQAHLERLHQRLNEWNRWSREVSQRLDRGEHESVLKELTEREKDPAWGLFIQVVQTEKERLQRAAKERAQKEAEQKKVEEAQRRKAEEEARQQAVTNELAQVRERRAAMAAAITQRNFRAARDAARKLWEEMQTPPGQAAAQFWVDASTALDAAMDFLASAVRRSPYRGTGTASLGGEVVALTGNGVLLALPGGAGTAEKPWRALPPSAWWEMLRHYLPSAPAAQRRQLWLAAVVYAWAFPELRASGGRAAELLIKEDPSLEPILNEQLPELFPKAAGSGGEGVSANPA